MPSELTDTQLYQLDLLSTFSLDDVSYMEVKKHNENKEQFSLEHHVAEQFSSKVIQSYYEGKSSTKLGKK